MNPLHFEDLEPRRFEDLVRQILYDFREWRSLEATGRLGSDDGFDARGLEIVAAYDADAEEEGGVDLVAEDDRLWLVQCKREKAIGPSLLKKYLNEIREPEKLYGIIFVASSDFSKKSMDVFRDWCSEKGLSERFLWGKAALEDIILQPKNDHLLFAYFGISLSIRRRSRKTYWRSITTTKRKIRRITEKGFQKAVIIRDAEDESYPFLRAEAKKPRGERRPRWRAYDVQSTGYKGLALLYKKYQAYLGENEEWDVSNVYNHAQLDDRSDPWMGVRSWDKEETRLRSEIDLDWERIEPPGQKAWLEICMFISYQDILEVDEIGDEITDLPHVFVNWNGGEHPSRDTSVRLYTLTPYDSVEIFPSLQKRIRFFRSELRRPIPGEGQPDPE